MNLNKHSIKQDAISWAPRLYCPSERPNAAAAPQGRGFGAAAVVNLAIDVATEQLGVVLEIDI